GPSRDEDVALGGDRRDEPPGKRPRQRADFDEVFERVSTAELANRQCRPSYGARRKHRGDARAILQPGIEDWLHLRDLVATRTRDVLDRHGQVPRFQRPIWYELEPAGSLDKDTPAPVVDHQLGDGWIAQQILDWSKEREDSIEAAHNAPRAT